MVSDTPKWLSIARGYMGITEWKGSKHNPIILEWWIKIRAPFVTDEIPWCAAYVGACLEEAGIRSSRSAAALSYAQWGKKLPYPAVGAVAYMERRNKAGKLLGGHVGFVEGVDKSGNIVLINGNADDTVKHSSFPPSRILGYRWPLSLPIPDKKPLPVFLTDISVSDRET